VFTGIAVTNSDNGIRKINNSYGYGWAKYEVTNYFGIISHNNFTFN